MRKGSAALHLAVDRTKTNSRLSPTDRFADRTPPQKDMKRMLPAAPRWNTGGVSAERREWSVLLSTMCSTEPKNGCMVGRHEVDCWCYIRGHRRLVGSVIGERASKHDSETNERLALVTSSLMRRRERKETKCLGRGELRRHLYCHIQRRRLEAGIQLASDSFCNCLQRNICSLWIPVRAVGKGLAGKHHPTLEPMQPSKRCAALGMARTVRQGLLVGEAAPLASGLCQMAPRNPPTPS
jgi:hypothetical protein